MGAIALVIIRIEIRTAVETPSKGGGAAALAGAMNGGLGAIGISGLGNAQLCLDTVFGVL